MPKIVTFLLSSYIIFLSPFVVASDQELHTDNSKIERIQNQGVRSSLKLTKDELIKYDAFLRGTGIEGSGSDIHWYDKLPVSEVNFQSGSINIAKQILIPLTADTIVSFDDWYSMSAIYLHEYTHAYNSALKNHLDGGSKQLFNKAIIQAAGLDAKSNAVTISNMNIMQIEFSVREELRSIEELLADLGPALYYGDPNAVVRYRNAFTKDFLISRGVSQRDALMQVNDYNLRKFSLNEQPNCSAVLSPVVYSTPCKLRRELARLWSHYDLSKASVATRQLFLGEIMNVFNNAVHSYQVKIINEIQTQIASGSTPENIKLNANAGVLEKQILDQMTLVGTKTSLRVMGRSLKTQISRGSLSPFKFFPEI